jgi:hypothetical protein
MRRSLIGFRVIGVVLLLGLAGCGGDPKTDPSPAPSTPVTSPASTTPSPPAMPDAARANTRAGAIAFVRHYIELINYAQATGDVGALAAVEEGTCKSCSAASEGVRKHYESGGAIKGGDWHVRSANVVRNDAISGWVVDLVVRFDRQVVMFGNSRPKEINPPAQSVISVQVSRSEDAWKVLEWTRGS